MGTKMGPNYANFFVSFTWEGTLITVLVQHHVLVSSWRASLTLLMISLQRSNSHGRSLRPVNCS